CRQRGRGIDVVDVVRMRRAVSRWGEAFLYRVFTPAEWNRGSASVGGAERLAGRFAAKEAVMKALGIGRRGIDWQEIEITVDPMGKPEERLTRRAAAMGDRLGITAWRGARSEEHTSEPQSR